MIEGVSSTVAGLALYIPEGARKRIASLGGERGQSFAEYALLLTIVAIAVALLTEWSNFTAATAKALQHIENVIGNPKNTTQ